MKSENREELVPRLGFRHIAGIMKWESLSKAVYIHRLVEKNGNQDFDTIGRDLSIDSANVKKNYLSYQIYLQAREQGIETKEIEDNFGVWYTALGNVNIQKFIGYNPRVVQKEKLKSPVAKGKMKELAELVGYIFGTAEVKKAIRESRDLQKLGQVLSSKDALDYLRNGGSFNDASSLIEGEEKTLLRILGRATLNLAESLQYIYRHSNDQEVKEAIKECGDAFLEVLKSFPEIKQAFVGQLGKDNQC
jgi:hypothetical protein